MGPAPRMAGLRRCGEEKPVGKTGSVWLGKCSGEQEGALLLIKGGNYRAMQRNMVT